MKDSETEAVILLHGLRQPSIMLYPLSRRLKHAGYQVHVFTYPSHKDGLAGHVGRFTDFFESVTKGYRKVSFAAHSLGSIISLRFLSEYSDITKVRRAVYLGPPLRGAQSARIGNSFFLTRHLFGPALTDLSRDNFPVLPTGPEIGIVVGGLGIPMGVNPILQGDNDGLVSVAETQSEGAKDVIFMRQTHWLMSSWPSVMNEVLHFLARGRFTETRRRIFVVAGSRIEGI